MPSHTPFHLPDLRFVPVGALFPHEWHDPQRSGPLIERLRESGTLRNPPIVTPFGDGHRNEPRYVVLDGANRSTAAHEAGWPHIVVQVVPYETPAVQLHTWYHGLTGDPADVLGRALHAVRGLETRRENGLHARAMLARREALAVIMTADDEALVLTGGRTLRERNALLNEIVRTYQDRVPYVRVATDLLALARLEHDGIAALVVFPRYDPAEVIELAGSGEHLPAGITRHLIQWRALRLNIPIAMFEDTTRTLEQKNEWLRAWTEQRFRQRGVRFYEEFTVLFDE